MKIIFSFIITFIFLGTVSCAHKKKAEAPKEEVKPIQKVEKKPEKKKPDFSYTCLVDKDTRLIEIDKKPKRCEVFYTKFGDKAQVAWAESTPSICSEVFQRIRQNIESKGFKCISKADTPSAAPEKLPEKATESVKSKEHQQPSKKATERESASVKQ